ncbi:hypothetical protein ABT402_38145, partial [Streptomyces sp. NPDC000351]
MLATTFLVAEGGRKRMEGPPIVVERWEGLECAVHLDLVLPMYKEIWADPPYCEGPREIAEFLDRFA